MINLLSRVCLTIQVVFKPITSEERFCFNRRMSDEVSNFVEGVEGGKGKTEKKQDQEQPPALPL
jgi:hypothetical protein